MRTIPTAEEFWKQRNGSDTSKMLPREIDDAIAFAKIQVEAALESAAHVLDVNQDADYIKHPTKEAILNSYPLNKIA